MKIELYNRQGPVETVEGLTAVTVGVFDGVHRGHQTFIAQLGDNGLVVTLTAHPSFVLGRKESEYWLDDPKEHLELLFEAGARYVAVLPFTRYVAQMSACEMARWMYTELNMRSLLLGYDSRFGSKDKDDFDRLPKLATDLGFTLQRGKPFTVDSEPISSSRIRQSLQEGRVEDTAALLGRNYSLDGTVQHGRGVGHTLGFPTANIDLAQTRKMLPHEGVYVVSVDCGERQPVRGIANLGAAPTFGVEKQLLEVHLMDYDGDLYGKHTTVEFLHRLRGIRRFDNSDELQRQIQQDLKEARRWS